MGKKNKFSRNVKLKACNDYISGKGTFESIAHSVGTGKTVVHRCYLDIISHFS